MMSTQLETSSNVTRSNTECANSRATVTSLVAVLHLALESNGPFRVRDIYPRYRTIAEQSDIDPLVRRRMHDHLADLAMLGILDRHSRNEGRSGGQYYEYEFSVDLDLVANVVSDFKGLDLPRRVVQLTRSVE